MRRFRPPPGWLPLRAERVARALPSAGIGKWLVESARTAPAAGGTFSERKALRNRQCLPASCPKARGS